MPDREQTKSEINENFEFIIPREKNLRNQLKPKREIAYMRSLRLSKKSGWSWAFSDRYGRMGKGDERCWNAGKWIEIW